MKAVKISGRAADVLLQVKRATKIEGMNVIGRCAFVLGQQIEGRGGEDKQGDKTVTIEWGTFAGQRASVYALLNSNPTTNDVSATVGIGLCSPDMPHNLHGLAHFLLEQHK